MRLDNFDRGGAGRIGGGVAEERDDSPLWIIHRPPMAIFRP